VQSSSQVVTTNKPTSNFLQAGCPSYRPTNSVKALKGNVPHSTQFEFTWDLSTFSLTTIGSELVTLEKGSQASRQPSDGSTPVAVIESDTKNKLSPSLTSPIFHPHPIPMMSSSLFASPQKYSHAHPHPIYPRCHHTM